MWEWELLLDGEIVEVRIWVGCITSKFVVVCQVS